MFNSAMGLFWGFVHQGAVIPSLLSSSTTVSSTGNAHFVYFSCYMPPRLVFASASERVHDFHKADGVEQFEAMWNTLRGQHVPTDSNHCANATFSFMFSGSVDVALFTPVFAKSGDTLVQDPTAVSTFVPHFSGEYPPRALGELVLRRYSLVLANQCAHSDVT